VAGELRQGSPFNGGSYTGITLYAGDESHHINNVGGIVGMSTDSNTSIDKLSVTIIAYGDTIGGVTGIQGSNRRTLEIKELDANITTTGSHVGGIMGVSGGGTIRVGKATVYIKTENQIVGGLVGIMNGGTLENISTVSTATVSANIDAKGGYIGGVVGYSKATMNKITVSGNITATGGSVGGAVGENTAKMNRVHSSVNVTNNDGNNNFGCGGLVGTAQNSSEIVYSSASGNVNTTRGSAVGGLVGWNAGNITASKATNGQLTGRIYVGGLIGIYGSYTSVEGNTYTRDAKVRDSYFLNPKTTITSTSSYVGGLIGLWGTGGPGNAGRYNFTLDGCYSYYSDLRDAQANGWNYCGNFVAAVNWYNDQFTAKTGQFYMFCGRVSNDHIIGTNSLSILKGSWKNVYDLFLGSTFFFDNGDKKDLSGKAHAWPGPDCHFSESEWEPGYGDQGIYNRYKSTPRDIPDNAFPHLKWEKDIK
jgi:hypothetical protein